MIFDSRTEEFRAAGKRYRVFRDGEEVKQVYYLDTERSVIKTFDVFGDGIAHAACGVTELPPGVDNDEGVLSKTIIGGSIELQEIKG